MPQVPSRSGEMLSKAADLVSEGKDTIESDLVQAVINSFPVIDNFVKLMDTIADVRTFCLDSSLHCSSMVTRLTHI